MAEWGTYLKSGHMGSIPLSRFPLALVSYFRYTTPISLTLLYAAWRRHGTTV
jgi:hypothetical protein